jgi:hypothetical protein
VIAILQIMQAGSLLAFASRNRASHCARCCGTELCPMKSAHGCRIGSCADRDIVFLAARPAVLTVQIASPTLPSQTVPSELVAAALRDGFDRLPEQPPRFR